MWCRWRCAFFAFPLRYRATTGVEMKERLIEAQAVADRLGLSRWRVYELVRKGVLPHVRINRRVLFDPTKVEEWIAAGGTAARTTQ